MRSRPADGLAPSSLPSLLPSILVPFFLFDPADSSAPFLAASLSLSDSRAPSWSAPLFASSHSPTSPLPSHGTGALLSLTLASPALPSGVIGRAVARVESQLDSLLGESLGDALAILGRGTGGGPGSGPGLDSAGAKGRRRHRLPPPPPPGGGGAGKAAGRGRGEALEPFLQVRRKWERKYDKAKRGCLFSFSFLAGSPSLSHFVFFLSPTHSRPNDSQ